MAKELVRYTADAVIVDPEIGAFKPSSDEVFDTDHPMVKKYRWAFTSDIEAADAQAAARAGGGSVVVEQATARPGEKRSTRKSE